MVRSLWTIAREPDDKALVVSVLALQVVSLAFCKVQKALRIDTVARCLDCDEGRVCCVPSGTPLLTVNHTLWCVRTWNVINFVEKNISLPV